MSWVGRKKSLRELIIAQPQTALGQMMHSKLITVHYNDSQRKVAEAIRKYSLLAIPVTDEQGALMGIITVDDVLDLLMPERTLANAMTIYLNKRAVRRG